MASTMTVPRVPGVPMSRSRRISRPASGSPSHRACAMRASSQWAGKNSPRPCRPTSRKRPARSSISTRRRWQTNISTCSTSSTTPTTTGIRESCWRHAGRRVRAKSEARGGVMIHMHLLQSPVQKAYGLRRHGKPTVFWLDDLGLVESNVAYGHAIHVTEGEIELMGRRQVSVTSHPSCNFHMRNGITPVMPLRAAGVNVAMGLDDKTINDDEDAVMELRMMHKVHRLHSFELTTPTLSAYEALEIATLNGAKAAGFAGEGGALLPGMKGDAILVDLDRVTRDPWIDPDFDIAEAFVERAMGADVATVVVGGRIVVEDHRPQTIDVDALYREVRRFCAKGLTPEQRARADLLARIKPYVQAWYGTWHENMLDRPFYRVNSRV